MSMMEEKSVYHQRFKKFNACVVIPTFNNAGTLASVIESVSEYTNDIFIINDGSTDGTEEILKKYSQFKSHSYFPNKGKGHALRYAFEWARESGFDYVISIDSDGQHFAEDLPVFIDKLEEKGPAIILGARNMEQEGIPGKSSFGHRFSNFWFWIETGVKAPDTQTGFRLYPVSLIKDMKFYTKKYEFEIEVLVRSSWKGIAIESVPIKVYYAPKETRISHFRPFKDFSRISLLNTVLVVITLSYIIPRNFLRSLFRRSTYTKLADKIVETNESRLHSSISLAFGVFMGIVPIWGFQMLVALLLAVVFKLNKLLVIISANISIPPMIPIIVFLSYKLGAVVLGDSAAYQPTFDSSISLDSIRVGFVQYVYGSIVLAVGAAIVTGLGSYLLLSILTKEKRTQQDG